MEIRPGDTITAHHQATGTVIKGVVDTVNTVTGYVGIEVDKTQPVTLVPLAREGWDVRSHHPGPLKPGLYLSPHDHTRARYRADDGAWYSMGPVLMGPVLAPHLDDDDTRDWKYVP